MYTEDTLVYRVAVEDFYRAYRQGIWHRFWSWITRRPTQLRAYETVVEPLGILDVQDLGLHEVPLDAIVGSVGRANDYTADFLPRRAADLERWSGIKMAVMRMSGLPPVTLFQVGAHYFVLDGHHRVSVSRQLRVPTITAHVQRVETVRPYQTAAARSVRPAEKPAIVL